MPNGTYILAFSISNITDNQASQLLHLIQNTVTSNGAVMDIKQSAFTENIT